MSFPLPTKLDDMWQGYKSGTPDLRTCFVQTVGQVVPLQCFPHKSTMKSELSFFNYI